MNVTFISGKDETGKILILNKNRTKETAETHLTQLVSTEFRSLPVSFNENRISTSASEG